MSRFAQLRPGDLVRIRAARWVVHQHARLGDVSSLDVRGADRANAGQQARFLLPFEPVEPISTCGTPRVVRPAAWRAAARHLLADATTAPDSLRAAARARLDVMAYQLEPALAVFGGYGCRLLIADDVGLGKTIQAGLIAAEAIARNPNARVLVICPSMLRDQWRHELRHRLDLTAAVLDAAGISRLRSAGECTANPWAAAPLVIASIDFIKRPEVMRALEGLIWDVVILDEAHHLAGRSDRSTAAHAIARRARIVVLLSATPHSGDDEAFARLCSIGDLHGRFPLLLFRRSRRDAGIPAERRTHWLRVSPSSPERQMHAALLAYAQRVWREPSMGDGGRLAMTVLLRRASSSPESLARSVERRLAALSRNPLEGAAQLGLPFVDDQSDEEPLGVIVARGLADGDEERHCLEQILALARAATRHESKVAALLRLIGRIGEPILLFTEYRDTLGHIHRALVNRGVSAKRIVELHGALTRSERERAEHRFVTGDADILIGTDAASEGLNLHGSCRCVINLEIPWTPVRLEQRIGRVDRIGQRRRVHAINLVANETYELSSIQRIVERSVRAAWMLAATTPSPEATAHAILTGIDVPPPQQRTLPPTIHRLELADRAVAEGQRITLSRQLGFASVLPWSRPAVSVLTNRPRTVLCAFELTLVDRLGIPVWATIVGAEGPWSAGRLSRGEVRRLVEPTASRFVEAIDPFAHSWTSLASTTIAQETAVALDREAAIAAAVRLRHARVAADLLQPGLFDRRSERLASAQTAVLEEALARCHAQMDTLAHREMLRLDRPALRFVVFR